MGDLSTRLLVWTILCTLLWSMRCMARIAPQRQQRQHWRFAAGAAANLVAFAPPPPPPPPPPLLSSSVISRKRCHVKAPQEEETKAFQKRTLSLWAGGQGGGDDDDEEDRWSLFRNSNNIADQAFAAISGDGGIKVTVATVRNLVNELMLMHNMTPVSADALGRAVVCTVLLSNGIQEDQIFQLTLNGDGPLRGVISISNGRGETRGYVGSPALGEMPLAEAVGKGTVQVVKNHPDWPVPYNGITAIRYGDIDRDVGIYLAESEQRSCALAAATSMNGILCLAAGGYLVEQLPNVHVTTVQKVEENLLKLVARNGGNDEKDDKDKNENKDKKLPTNLLLQGVTPVEIAAMILDGLDMEPLQQVEPKLYCECSMERLVRSVRLLPRNEVEDILASQEQIEATCQFCGKVYRLGPDEVRQRLAASFPGDPSKDAPET